ncbi:Bifunctional hemolysin/adenylate cyclase [Falsiruegeria mediterranea M17]|uniref:Bifunctional hemolysin/adenylate cyclase n=1 Tax=Falsiruegeria mediterranea M17 TaxID=1200281 RepID=A0A2R8C624_9RHOB|nr:Bifunctional hemolysin/adenylate cyclase [Falsiruegeria mediterranea M17]
MPTLSRLSSVSIAKSDNVVREDARVAAFNDGRQVLVWQDSSPEIFFRLLNEDGSPAGEVVQVASSSSTPNRPDVAVLSDGNFLVVYTHVKSAGGADVRGVKYDQFGRLVDDGQVLIPSSSETTIVAPEVIALVDGGFAVAATGLGYDGSLFSAHSRSFDHDGTPRGELLQLNQTEHRFQSFPEIAPLEDGGFAAVWRSHSVDGSFYAVMLRILDDDGTPLSGEIRLNQYSYRSQIDPVVAQLSDGSLIVVWKSDEQDGSGETIVARHVSAQGVPIGNEFIVNQTTQGDQTQPQVIALNDGGFVVAWVNVSDNPTVVAREYNSNIEAVSGEVQLSESTADYDVKPSLVALPDGGISVIWQSVDRDNPLSNSALHVRVSLPDLNATDGDDVITDGSALSRILALDGNDWITPGAGSDTIDGGAGFDMVSFIDQQQAVRVDLAQGRATSGADTNQILNVEGVTGSSFADYIAGDDGDNRLRGAGDYDWFIGSGGLDFYDGGSGRDMVSYVSSTRGVNVDLTTGRGSAGLASGDRYQNVERVTGSSYSDVLKGDAGDNDLRGLGDYDWFLGTAGRDRYDGGSGLDMISYSDPSSAVSVDLSQGRGKRGDAARDSYVSIERVTGSSYDDDLVGDGGNNLLRGLYGEDTLYGGAGVDRLIGGASDDYLDGGLGWDYAIFDGARDDYHVSRKGSQVLVENLSSGRGGTDTLVNIEVIQFSDDLLYL